MKSNKKSNQIKFPDIRIVLREKAPFYVTYIEFIKYGYANLEDVYLVRPCNSLKEIVIKSTSGLKLDIKEKKKRQILLLAHATLHPSNFYVIIDSNFKSDIGNIITKGLFTKNFKLSD